MPIPDEIIPKESETEDQAAQRKRWEVVTEASNNMMEKATKCEKVGAYCFKCSTICPEMKEWETVADSGDKK